jgi:hypothetical protein
VSFIAAAMVGSAAWMQVQPSRRAHAQDGPAVNPPRTAGRAAAAPTVGKAELARAFQRLEAAVADRPDGMARAELNRRFDALTMLFFQNRLAEAVDALDALTLDVLGIRGDAERDGLLRAMQVRIAPARSALLADESSMAVRVDVPRSGSTAPLTLRAGAAIRSRSRPP